MRRGELIRLDDPEYPVIEELITRAFRITGELNAGYHDAAETRAVMSELTGELIDETTWIVPPFYTDFGRFTRFGRNAFVNCGCGCPQRRIFPEGTVATRKEDGYGLGYRHRQFSA